MGAWKTEAELLAEYRARQERDRRLRARGFEGNHGAFFEKRPKSPKKAVETLDADCM